MNFDELGIRKKDINEKRIDLIQREISREFPIVGKTKIIFCYQQSQKRMPKFSLLCIHSDSMPGYSQENIK